MPILIQVVCFPDVRCHFITSDIGCWGPCTGIYGCRVLDTLSGVGNLITSVGNLKVPDGTGRRRVLVTLSESVTVTDRRQCRWWMLQWGASCHLHQCACAAAGGTSWDMLHTLRFWGPLLGWLQHHHDGYMQDTIMQCRWYQVFRLSSSAQISHAYVHPTFLALPKNHSLKSLLRLLCSIQSRWTSFNGFLIYYYYCTVVILLYRLQFRFSQMMYKTLVFLLCAETLLQTEAALVLDAIFSSNVSVDILFNLGPFSPCVLFLKITVTSSS